jgi:hypothetical protein
MGVAVDATAIIDGDNLNVILPSIQKGPHNQTPNASKTVDGNA